MPIDHRLIRFKPGDIVKAEYRTFQNEVIPPLLTAMVQEACEACPPDFPVAEYLLAFELGPRSNLVERWVKSPCIMRL